MKPKIKTKLVIFIVLTWSIYLTFALVSAKSTSETKEGHIFINDPAKSGSFFISFNSSPNGAGPEGASQNEVISPVLRADFPFNALFARWSLKDQENANLSQNDFDLYVKLLHESWTGWYQIRFDDDNNGKDNSPIDLSSQMIPTKLTDTFQYRLVFHTEAAKQNLKNLDFIYLDTTKGPSGNFKIAANQDANNLNIITRKEWGANENYRFDTTGQDLWPEEYYNPLKFVIHHTAGEDANLDPEATLRAIYYWHAKGKDWGDIGYNYLIDSKGNIYEGRFGGEGVVGGHAYLRNRNTIGISILGCYDTGLNQNNKPNCNTPTQLTEATQTALNKLIAEKSQEFKIDPNGSSEFHGQILPNVLGHRDIGNTACPGNLIYNLLPQTRQLAYNILQNLGGFKKPLPSSAEFVSLSAKEINIEDTKTAAIYAEFKNTGQETWRGYEDNYLYVSDASLKNKLAKIDSVKIALASDLGSDKAEEPETAAQPAIFKLLGGNVYPGEIGKFKLTLNPPQGQKSQVKNFILAWQDKGYFPNTDFSITLNKIPCTTCNLAPNQQVQPIYQAVLSQSDFPSQMAAGNLPDVKIQWQNSGNQNWDKNKLKLKIYYDNQQISPFRNDSWYTEFASIPPAENSIAPGSIATFNFKLKAPNVLASFPHKISLAYDDKEIAQVTQTIDVISSWSAQISANDLPASIKTNKRPKITITFKNTGAKTWTNLALKSYDLDNTNSWFKDWSWQDSKTIKKIKKTIKPGEEIQFTFRLLAYWKPDKYPQVFRLFDGKTQIYLDGQKDLVVYTQVTK